MNNPQNSHQPSPHNVGRGGAPRRRQRRSTPGEVTLHIIVIVVLMVSTGFAFKMSNNFGAIAAAISICIVVFMNNRVNIRLTNRTAKFLSNKIDQFYMMIVSIPLMIYFALFGVIFRAFLVALIIVRLFFIFFSHPTLPSYCVVTGNLSVGCTMFDVQNADKALKLQAATLFKLGRIQEGITVLYQAYKQDSSDPEIPIYISDQIILASHTPFYSIVANTILTGRYAYIGYDGLQGIAVAQQEYNATHATKALVIVANFGSDQTISSAKVIANEIVHRMILNHPVIAMIGPPSCSQTRAVIDALHSATIPVISSASCDDLVGYSKNLFLIAPSYSLQAKAAAEYAKKQHYKTIAVFTNKADTEDSYAQATDFERQFRGRVFEEPYVPTSVQKLVSGLQDISHLHIKTDAIFFAGYPDDLNALLENLPGTSTFTSLPVIGLEPLYALGGYKTDAKTRIGFSHLKIVALFYPDEVSILNPTSPEPQFFSDYTHLFDSGKSHTLWPYGYNRMDSEVALNYDAMAVLFNALADETISQEDAIAGLKNTAEHGAWQGITGQINFANNNAPVNKAIVLLWVDSNTDDIHMAGLIGGCYLKERCLSSAQEVPDMRNYEHTVTKFLIYNCNILTPGNIITLPRSCLHA